MCMCVCVQKCITVHYKLYSGKFNVVVCACLGLGLSLAQPVNGFGSIGGSVAEWESEGAPKKAFTVSRLC